MILPPEVFRPRDGVWPTLIVHIYGEDGEGRPWSVPAETVRQISADFDRYLAERGN